ncbi:vitrin-like [Ruditapes philippinarum]|uniref:vitrin-like n=1 Tax=Ruditapes philippinarum TaxID=129788 RepID=UPI00295A842C|nr:vitrin-like [Ruditapes philippinarum]
MISCCYKVILFFLCLMITETWSFWNTSSKVDCSVTPWSPWSSVNGQQTRMRRIMRHSQNGGEPCPSVSETKDPNSDCTVSSWSTWSAVFGFGQQSRVRTVITQPTGTGKQCPVLEEIRYTGKIPSVNVTAKNVQNFFARPSGKVLSQTIKSSQIQSQDLSRDLVIIMDSSGSIGSNGFQVAKEQTAKLMGLLCPTAPFDKIAGSPYQYNQAAMLTYSTNVVENFDFNRYSTTVNIQNAIKRVRYAGGGTSTNKAFDQARGLFQPNKGVRDAARAKREVLILTDGRSNSQSQTLAAVRKLKLEADVYGLMIGSFSTSGMNELTQYVSSPINEHLFCIENFQQLKDLLALIEDTKKKAGVDWCAPFN